MPLFEVEFYETANGKQPAKDFLLSLDKKMRAKMLSMITILAENGTELREPYSKSKSQFKYCTGFIFLLVWRINYPDKRIYQENSEDTF